MNICVYCGSSTRAEARYLAVGETLGRLLAQGGHTLVYGAGSIGVMGSLARAVHAHGGRVIGVIPTAMVSEEVAYRPCDEFIEVANMRQRKAVMDERADAFIALPGGFGTLEELIEVITHRHLGFHAKPVVLVNTDGFYDPLLELFAHFVKHRFAKEKHLQAYQVAATPEEALALLAG